MRWFDPVSCGEGGGSEKGTHLVGVVEALCWLGGRGGPRWWWVVLLDGRREGLGALLLWGLLQGLRGGGQRLGSVRRGGRT